MGEKAIYFSMEGFNFSFYLLHGDIAALSYLIIRGSSWLTPQPPTSDIPRGPCVVVSRRLLKLEP